MKKTLYKKDAKGQLRFWEIEAFDDGFEVRYGVDGGEVQTKYEEIHEGKAARDVEEQIELQFNSKVNKRLDAGYVLDKKLAEERAHMLNSMGLLKPMLASKYNAKKLPDLDNCYWQPKLDGHRCLITKLDGELVAYSRNGKPINSIDHILEDITIDEGETLDGELYHHRTPLQTITSWVKKSQEDSRKLKYMAYDFISWMCYEHRYRKVIEAVGNKTAIVTPTRRLSDADNIIDLLGGARREGYEGLILRPDGYGYEDSKRSKGLIKVKEFEDDEFKVIEIKPSKDEWAILICEMDNGKTFRVSAPGNHHEKKLPLLNKDAYLNHYVRVEYANLTKDGVPFHPVATMFRDKFGE